MDVNGICCSTFGHGIKGKNVEHDYFGSEKIVNDLRRFESFKTGFI